MHVIIGSGPAALGCADALLEKGLPVTLIDAGLGLEAERADARRILGGMAPDAWSAETRVLLRPAASASPRKKNDLPTKLTFGSDFPYRHAAVETPYTLSGGADLSPSLGEGGFSNVWGGAILPYTDRELAGWPIRAAELDSHYRAAMALLGPTSGTLDAIDTLFPHPIPPVRSLRPTRQVSGLLANLAEKSEELRARGVVAGASRLAVDVKPCVYCGECLTGCPYDLIFNSAKSLRKLERENGLRIESGWIAETLDEREGAVHVELRAFRGTEKRTVRATRVYLACGVLNTSRLLMASRKLYDRPVEFLDSQYFLVPLLRSRATKDVRSERLHTLAQAFVEVIDPAISANLVHLQIYGYSETLAEALRNKLGPLGPVFGGAALAPLLDRLLLVQGYLHSDDSAKLQMRLASGTNVLEVSGHARPETRATVKRVVRKLRSERRAFRALPLTPGLVIAPPGRGFHSGGSFPMRASGDGVDFSSDVWGRALGFNRVHAIDATVFPTIPAATITLSVMANAHRIAAEGPNE